MNDNIFLDSNILVYCFSTSDARKQEISRSLANLDNVHISTQVLNETTNVLAKKYHITWTELGNLITDFETNFIVHTVPPFEIKKACSIAEKYGFSFFDSLMVTSAIEANCSILYSEDMHNGQIVDNKLKIVNPFL